MHKIIDWVRGRILNIQKGFTLIELLVVIAIIALLASIILVSLSSAQGKARDATRLQSLQEMAKAIAIQDTGSPQTLSGCDTSTGKVDASTCTGVTGGSNFAPSWANYKDASKSATLCDGTVTSACQYSIVAKSSATAKASTEDYEICTYIENNEGSLNKGPVSVSSDSGSSVIQGC